MSTEEERAARALRAMLEPTPPMTTVRGLIAALESLLAQAGADDMPIRNAEMTLTVEDEAAAFNAAWRYPVSMFPERPALHVRAE